MAVCAPRNPSYPCRTAARIILGVAVILGASVMSLVGAPSDALAAPAQSSADLFVTSPPGTLLATPGAAVATTLTVGNIGRNPLTVRIATEGVQLLNNGRTRMVAGENPAFKDRITIAPDQLNLAPRSQQHVKISINVPHGLDPDDYFLGFLVSPVITSSSVVVQNDIGALVILNVPGPRNRKLTARYVGVPSIAFSLSSSASGFVRAESVGHSTLQFSTTVEISGRPSPRPGYMTAQAHLLPPGLTWDIPIKVTSWLGLGWYTFHTTLVYNLTDQKAGEVAIDHTVIIVNPLWFLVLLPILVLLLMRWRSRRRKRRKSRQPLHSAKRRRERSPQHSAKRPVSPKERRRSPVPVP